MRESIKERIERAVSRPFNPNFPKTREGWMKHIKSVLRDPNNGVLASEAEINNTFNKRVPPGAKTLKAKYKAMLVAKGYPNEDANHWTKIFFMGCNKLAG